MAAKETRDGSIVGGRDRNLKEKVAECSLVDGWKSGGRGARKQRNGLCFLIDKSPAGTVLLQCLEGG